MIRRCPNKFMRAQLRRLRDDHALIDDAPELDNRAVASALHDPAVMHGDCRIDQVAPKGAEPSEYSILVRACKPRVADDVGDQDRSQLPGLGHGAGAEAAGIAGGLAMAALPCCTWKLRGGRECSPVFGS